MPSFSFIPAELNTENELHHEVMASGEIGEEKGESERLSVGASWLGPSGVIAGEWLEMAMAWMLKGTGPSHGPLERNCPL